MKLWSGNDDDEEEEGAMEETGKVEGCGEEEEEVEGEEEGIVVVVVVVVVEVERESERDGGREGGGGGGGEVRGIKPSTADRAIVIAHGAPRNRGREEGGEEGKATVVPFIDASDNDSCVLEDVEEEEKMVEVEDGGHDTGYTVAVDFTVTVLR